MTSDSELSYWIGRTESVADTVLPATIARLWAILDRDDLPPSNGTAVPLLAHWLYFLGAARQSDLDIDGHEARGHFLPPVRLPRRMWAGSKLIFHRPLIIGSDATRTSTVTSIVPKQGHTGSLVFVGVRHQIADTHGVAITEDQNIVYREPARAIANRPSEGSAGLMPQWSRKVTPDVVMLFRYSALTFNGHRIHYDRDYAVNREGYPGLIVHGPLIATLLFDLMHRFAPKLLVREAEVRALNPLFDGQDISLNGYSTPEGAVLWASGRNGNLAMRIEVRS